MQRLRFKIDATRQARDVELMCVDTVANIVRDLAIGTRACSGNNASECAN